MTVIYSYHGGEYVRHENGNSCRGRSRHPCGQNELGNDVVFAMIRLTALIANNQSVPVCDRRVLEFVNDVTCALNKGYWAHLPDGGVCQDSDWGKVLHQHHYGCPPYGGKPYGGKPCRSPNFCGRGEKLGDQCPGIDRCFAD